jgi:hypothetical protein
VKYDGLVFGASRNRRAFHKGDFLMPKRAYREATHQKDLEVNRSEQESEESALLNVCGATFEAIADAAASFTDVLVELQDELHTIPQSRESTVTARQPIGVGSQAADSRGRYS